VFSRVDTVNPELLARMREAGCTWMLYGVESGNQEILDTVKKKITLDKIREGVRMAREAGIDVLASFIIGLPGESRETLQQNIRFGLELQTPWGFNVLSPFPGTEVREKAEEYGIEILTSDWTKYDANTPVTRTKDAGPEEITEVLNQYNEGLARHMEDLVAEGKTDLDVAARSGVRSPLAWHLLQDDVIEALGPVAMSADPVGSLVDRLAEVIPYTREEISKNVNAWVDGRLLEYDRKDGGLVWRWS
jgi:anaerobic magnesium-protoporphyrin IX monomethyl ester cyclase